MYADVIVDIVHNDVDKIFEYSVDCDNVKVGSRVVVPFGTKFIEGIVIGIKEKSNFSPERIKPIKSVLDEVPVLTDETLSLMKYIVSECYVTKASALRLFLPVEMRKGKVKERIVKYASLADGVDADGVCATLNKNAVRQKDAVYFLAEGGKRELAFLNERFGAGAVKSLIGKGLIVVTEEREMRSPYTGLLSDKKRVTLTDKQKAAVETVEKTDKTTTLIYGVTGSGKTEIYLELIDRAISEGKTAIMLVPEISLTPQMLSQLRARFGTCAAIIHSGLSAGERFDEWWRLRCGTAKIAIGARSAIFAPLDNLGVIIMDEEHDGSYISESSPRYSTVEVAKYRATLSGAKLVLGSATPSVESFMYAQNGEYGLITLPERINKKPLPDVEIVDMRREIRKGNNSPFSSALKAEIAECLEKGNQAMIFLNQRGYSKTVICTECGHVQKCDACDVSLTYHREDNALLCHYCGAKYKMITACTACGSVHIRYGGFGTEKIVDELKRLYPKARILRMDRDTTQNKEGHFKILKEFAERRADILVGTQMIAKGHDFPAVTLVGILDADMSLHFSDYRSAERTFQLLTQVAGRCGRAEESGRVVLQTYSPENHVLLQAVNYDYDGFYKREISIRKATGFPPFTDICRVLISGENDEEAINVTKFVYQELSAIYNAEKDKFRFFGCMKSPIKRLQNKFRYQVLMRIDKNDKNLRDRIFYTSDKYRSRTVNVVFEINPSNLN